MNTKPEVLALFLFLIHFKRKWEKLKLLSDIRFISFCETCQKLVKHMLKKKSTGEVLKFTWEIFFQEI